MVTVGFKPLKHIKTMSPYLWEGTPLQRPISWCCLFQNLVKLLNKAY